MIIILRVEFSLSLYKSLTCSIMMVREMKNLQHIHYGNDMNCISRILKIYHIIASINISLNNLVMLFMLLLILN